LASKANEEKTMRSLKVLSAFLGQLKHGLLVLAFIAISMLLAGCNSGSLGDGLESAATPQPAQSLEAQASTDTSGVTTTTPATADPNVAGTQVAALPTGKAVAFLPVSNAPQAAVSNLARSIQQQAASNGVAVVASVQQGAEYQVKGYFSALEDGSGTLLVYVWDVLDRSNKRVYRINGQEQAAKKTSDPWESVSPEMLDRVAGSTMSQLKSWLATR
jgi:hypothetical protein